MLMKNSRPQPECGFQGETCDMKKSIPSVSVGDAESFSLLSLDADEI